MAQIGETNVTAVLDRERLGAYRILVVCLCGRVAMLDGFDTQGIAFVAPAIAQQWSMDVSAFGLIFGAGLLGLMLGALTFGPVADRFGRRIGAIAAYRPLCCFPSSSRSCQNRSDFLFSTTRNPRALVFSSGPSPGCGSCSG